MIKRIHLLHCLFLLASVFGMVCQASAGLDAPHDASKSIGCLSCHEMTSTESMLIPPMGHVAQDIDDTLFNNLCWSCHNEVIAPYVKTHSSLQSDSSYGQWTVECWVCHNQHFQSQNLHNGSSYGKFIRRSIDLKNITGLVKTGVKEIKLLGNNGLNSFADNDADGDGIRDGICEVCHTMTTHFRNDGSGSDQLHANVGNVAGKNCMTCHNHRNGFAHGGGSGAGCIECHGHDAGIVYGETADSPYTPNVGGATSMGAGSFQSHSTHTENFDDDLKGPAIYCNACHDVNSFPSFASGSDTNGDGRIDLSETDVCDTCHSPGGTYDGINDPVIGAKAIWRSGAYTATDESTLRTNKEKWCATCHDESASLISSVTAPNVIGDEDGAYTYGTGWGYYQTGHGLGAGEQFPSKGGVETLSGRPVECDSCHDYATAHIDGASRTYDDGDVFGLDPAVYRHGYRLKLIGGQEPMVMPRKANIGNNADQFRVCFQIGCHDSGPFIDSGNMNTNLVTDGINRHTYHLNFNNQEMHASDWSGAYNSRMTCVGCHNVHGSTRLAMVRDGKLIDSEPGQEIWYKHDAISYITPGTQTPPIPENLTLSASDGTAWIPTSSGNLCVHCHPSNGFLGKEDRTPFQDIARAPVLEWAGITGLTADGVVPDNAVGGSTFLFLVSYSDINNDSPTSIEVWVDLNDNGSYEVDEKYAMTGSEALDTNLVDGKSYSKRLTIAKAGDSVLNYRFYAHDGSLEASGAPTADSTLTILNTTPTLAWTGADFYLVDGVNPDTGGNGATFTFRITYTDSDNELPSIVQVWVDANDDDIYEDGEKYALTEVDSGDTTISDGKLYTGSLSLTRAGDGDLSYRFYAADAYDNATGVPTQDSLLTVQVGANSPPVLEFVAADCTVSGVKPQLGATGGDFVFTVRYTDTEGQCPSGAGDIQLWVDANDNLIYEATEQHDLTAIDTGDSDCIDGKLYTTTRVLTLAGDNVLNYRFQATDGSDTALGAASSDQSVTVVDALKVRPAGGSGWYSTIQSAIDAVNGAHTVLVSEGTYNEDLVFEFGSNDSNTQVRSLCGPDTTIINGSGSGSVVTFNRYSGNMLDGFQVTGGTTGIDIRGTNVTINNCRVHDNNSLGGITAVQSGDLAKLTLSNSEIYNNSSDRGAGVLIWRGTDHSISNSIIRNNTAVGNDSFDGGGGLYFSQVDTVTISNSIISDNATVGAYPGGGIYLAQVVELTVSDSIIADNSSGNNGGGILCNSGVTINLIRSRITGNTAVNLGGALCHNTSSNNTSFENCIVADNRAAQAGVARINGGSFDIINSTIANNQATVSNSGAIYNQLGTITIRNSILWGNQAATVGHIAFFNDGSMTISDSVIQGGADGSFTNAPFFNGNVTPVVTGFVSDDNPWFMDSGDYHIQAFSSAIDKASATYAPAVDIDGQSRPQGDADDIGAYEYSP